MTKNNSLNVFSNSLQRNKSSEIASREVPVKWAAQKYRSYFDEIIPVKKSKGWGCDYQTEYTKICPDLSQKSEINYWTVSSLCTSDFYTLKVWRETKQ